MSDVGSSDNDLENSFTDSESEDSDFENLVEGLGLEPYQFEPTKQVSVSDENPHQPEPEHKVLFERNVF